MAIQDPHSTACETTIFAGSLAILVADDSDELQSYVWWWHPHFSWFEFLESTSIPTFVPWISLKSRIRVPPPLATPPRWSPSNAVAACDRAGSSRHLSDHARSTSMGRFIWIPGGDVMFFSGKPQASGHDSGWQNVEIYSKKNVKTMHVGVTKQILLIQNICSHT